MLASFTQGMFWYLQFGTQACSRATAKCFAGSDSPHLLATSLLACARSQAAANTSAASASQLQTTYGCCEEDTTLYRRCQCKVQLSTM